MFPSFLNTREWFCVTLHKIIPIEEEKFCVIPRKQIIERYGQSGHNTSGHREVGSCPSTVLQQNTKLKLFGWPVQDSLPAHHRFICSGMTV